MLTWIVFLAYWILFSWIITRISFFNAPGLSKKWLIILFGIKILAGLAYTWFYSLPQYKDTSDTLEFFHFSKIETDILLNDPVEFFKSLFSYNYQTSGNLFLAENSYWNDLKNNVIVKIFALINIFTGKNYYAAIIFFNFLFFFGIIAIYRLMVEMIPDKRNIILAALYCIPSFLFWCSGVHKDGLLFTGIGLTLYYFHRSLVKGFSFRKVLIIFLNLLLIFSLRNYLALALAIILVLITFYKKFPKRKLLITSFFFIIGFCTFFYAKHVHPALDFPSYIVQKQSEFLELTGDSEIAIPKLQSSISSFISFFPTAMDLGFFRPHIGEWKNKSYVPASFEIILFWMVCFFIIWKSRKHFVLSPIGLGMLVFSFLIFLLVGYTVMFSGAIVRYRALMMPLVILGLLSSYNNINKKYI